MLQTGNLLRQVFEGMVGNLADLGGLWGEKKKPDFSEKSGF